MKTFLKWLIIIGGVFAILIVAAIIVVPQLVDVNKHKPTIEEKVSQATGRAFTMGDDIDVSVFPWVGVKVTDVLFGNPEGFSQKQMITVKTFEVRLKVMPLLSKKIEVKTFVLENPVIHLEKKKNGEMNWTNIGQKKSGVEKPVEKKTAAKPSEGLPIAELKVENFAITNGQLTYTDQVAGTQKKITGLNLTLSDISLDRPININFQADLDGKPVSLTGKAGPIGTSPGKGTVNIDMTLALLDELNVKLSGSLTDPAVSQTMDLVVDVAAFSPKKLMAALGQPLPVQPKDPKVLEKVAFKTRIQGSPKSVRLSDGRLVLDDSTLDFSASAKEFNKPDITFDLVLDAIDLDRYLPEPASKEGDTKPKKSETPADKKSEIDYGPLRKLVLDGKVKVGSLKVSNASVQDIIVHVVAKNGLITIDPMDLKLYKGTLDSAMTVNVQKKEPKTGIKLSAEGIQAGPMITDVMQKELIEGTLKSTLDIQVTGDTPDRIKQTLTGKGLLLFNDGAILGIDLADSVRNVKSKLGLAEKPTEKPRTDFAELKIPFTSKSGLVTIDGTSLVSPLLRVLMDGKVNLPKEELDVLVEPKFVATLKGQGDEKQRSGLMVPVLITGTFASPKIRPDLKGLIGSGAGGLDAEGLKKKLLDGQKDQNATIETGKEDVKKQFKSLLPGMTN